MARISLAHSGSQSTYSSTWRSSKRYQRVNSPTEWPKSSRYPISLFNPSRYTQRFIGQTAAIWNETEFADLESRSAEIFAAIHTPSTKFSGRTSPTRSPAQSLLLSVIKGSVGVKAHIVTVDERETGLRNLVNFGHTIGHAIEAVLTPGALHGECVSVGMMLEAEVARQLGVLGQVAIGRLARCLRAYNLPVALTDASIAGLPAARGLTVSRLLDIMRVDKKNAGAEKRVVLLARVGKTLEERATPVADSVIAKVLCHAAKVVPGKPRRDPVRMATPGSKSISNRALVLAALGRGTCRLSNLLHSDDTQVMMAALQELKVIIQHSASRKLLFISLVYRAPNLVGKTVERPSSSKAVQGRYPCLQRGKSSTSATLAPPHASSLPSALSSSPRAPLRGKRRPSSLATRG
jgi:hypothetical protein